ncbi:MAG: sigma-70 family RNA polymerase sigma factor [Lachnospiraceae bacterium]|nr:sigma-70 family RNA polymerase sigma factor [Lachnospiraceae bacterium]
MDATEFRHIVLPQYELMYRIAFSAIGNSEDAQDAVQDAVTKLWVSRSRLASVDCPKAFILRAARNAAIDLLKSKANTTANTDELNETPEERADISDAIDAKDSLQRVNRLIEKLDPLQREILLMRSHSGLSLAEIAELKGISHDNARTILSRARKRLKELYNRTI